MDNGAGRIARIDPATNAVVQEITIGGNLGGMVLVGDVIWVTAQPTDEQGLVIRVDPATSTVTTSLGVSGIASSTSGLNSLTTDGTSLWVAADWSDSHELLRIDSP